jgi:ParB family chromosome partitioning protein
MESMQMLYEQNLQQINLDKLVPFKDHPFELYSDERLHDMIQSIISNGVLVPIVVRPSSDGLYEILSGHNRVAAATNAMEVTGVKTIPAVVRDDLTDEDAFLVVTETNLIQRSFADMKHSERAVVIATHYNAIKKKSGYRTDLLEEIGVLVKSLSPVVRKSSMDIVGEQYGLSKDTIARYLRVNTLVPVLKKRLDEGEIALRVAVTISYLSRAEQEAVDRQLVKGRKLSIKIANVLRAEAQKGELSKTIIKQVFDPQYFESRVKPVKFSGKFLSEFFDESKTPAEIEATVAEALRAFLNK